MPLAPLAPSPPSPPSPSEEVLLALANLTEWKDVVMAATEGNLTVDDGGGAAQSFPVCDGPTPEQIETYKSVCWWLEGAAQIALGCAGFVANAVAIPILLSKEMSSIFNRLLTCMAVIDNVFIVCSVMEAVRKHIVNSLFQEYLFGYFLYQFHNMILCCCIYITVVLALERYRAVWHPVEYHHVVNAGNPWKRVFYCISPVLLFAVLFNLPKFFEVTFRTRTYQRTEFDAEEGEFRIVNVSETRLAPTHLRLDDDYVLWYSNVARLVVTGVVPFASLTYLNSRIYQVIRRRRRMTNRPRAAPSAAQKAEEARQAIVLLVIVILFLICHTLRIILNIHGLFNLKIVRQGLQNGCPLTSLWALYGTSVSHILLTVNSSVNFVIYCFLCTTFRGILYRYVNRLVSICGIKKLLPDLHTLDAGGGGGRGGGRGGGGGAGNGATPVATHEPRSPPRQQTVVTATTNATAASTATGNVIVNSNNGLNGNSSSNHVTVAAVAAAAKRLDEEKDPLLQKEDEEEKEEEVGSGDAAKRGGTREMKREESGGQSYVETDL